jgi:hypothetical protein
MIQLEIVLRDALSFTEIKNIAGRIFNMEVSAIDVISDIEEFGTNLLTCLVTSISGDSFNQSITFYLDEIRFDEMKSALLFSQLTGIDLLVANDATVDPYSMLKISSNGAIDIVQIDPEQLDEFDKYVIISSENS